MIAVTIYSVDLKTSPSVFGVLGGIVIRVKDDSGFYFPAAVYRGSD